MTIDFTDIYPKDDIYPEDDNYPEFEAYIDSVINQIGKREKNAIDKDIARDYFYDALDYVSQDSPEEDRKGDYAHVVESFSDRLSPRERRIAISKYIGFSDTTKSERKDLREIQRGLKPVKTS